MSDAPPLRVLVAGSRHWRDVATIRQVLATLPPGSTVVHGDNGYDAAGRPLWGQPDHLAVRGADKLAGRIAAELGFRVERYTPRWRLLGRRAGPDRNARMLASGVDLVIAFHDDPARSRGTADLLRRARALGIPVQVVPSAARRGTGRRHTTTTEGPGSA